MAINNHTTQIQIGPHTGVTDFTDVVTNPAKFFHLATPITPDPDYNREDRSGHQSCNGEPLPSLVVEKDMSFGQDISILLRGLSGGGADDGVNAGTLGFPLEDVFQSCWGTRINGVGELTDAIDGGSGNTLGLDAGMAGALGTAFLVKATTSGKYLAREIYSKGGTNATMCRPLTTDQNAADTPLESEDVYAGVTFTAGNQITARTHWFVDAENAGAWRRLITGALSNMVLKFEKGKKAVVTLNNIVLTDWTRPAVATPTCTEASGGNTIPAYDSPMWIGNDLYMAKSLTVDLRLSITPIETDGGPNGHWGFAIVRCLPHLKFMLHAGSTTAPYKVTDAQLDAFRGDNVYDCLWQFGRTPGSACAIRVPALDFTKAKRVAQGGLEMIDCEATATDASSVATAEGNDPIRFHVF